eukprot:UN31456
MTPVNFSANDYTKQLVKMHVLTTAMIVWVIQLMGVVVALCGSMTLMLMMCSLVWMDFKISKVLINLVGPWEVVWFEINLLGILHGCVILGEIIVLKKMNVWISLILVNAPETVVGVVKLKHGDWCQHKLFRMHH